MRERNWRGIGGGGDWVGVGGGDTYLGREESGKRGDVESEWHLALLEHVG